MLYLVGQTKIDNLNQNKKKRVLIYGANKEGRLFMSAISNNDDMNIIGFLDDETSLHNNTIDGLNVYNREIT